MNLDIGVRESEAEKLARKSVAVLSERYAKWHTDCENLVIYSAFDGREIDRYSVLNRQWSDSFSEVISKDLFDVSRTLNLFISTLAVDSGNKSRLVWEARLEKILPSFEADYMRLREDGVFSSLESEASKYYPDDIMRIFIVRSQIRAARDDCSRPEAISGSLDMLSEIRLQSSMNVVYNLKGNIRSCAAYHSLRPDSKSIGEICSDTLACFSLSIRDYERAGSDSRYCSFDYKRWKNNELDLLIRLAMSKESVEESMEEGNRASQLGMWLSSPSAFAYAIEEKVNSMWQCNKYEPFIPLIIYTSSQAEATVGMLKEKANLTISNEQTRSDPSTNYLRAGILLAISESYHPDDIHHWFHDPFCYAIKSEAFSDGYSSVKIDPSYGLIDTIRRNCSQGEEG
jgi:hypothetical protein